MNSRTRLRPRLPGEGKIMQMERRRAHRQGLDSLVYLDLEPDNGGILLNLSENGMHISVANRLVTSSEIRFTLCLQPAEVIRGTGRIVWLSPSGRSAGVHFLSLPEEARREIRQWLGVSADSSSAEDGRERLEPAAPAREAFRPEPVEAGALVEPAAEALEGEAPASLAAQASEPAAQALNSEFPLPAIETVLESAAPVAMDALEVLESSLEERTIEHAPPAWAPLDSPRAADAEPALSVLSLYGIDGCEQEKPESAAPAAPARDGTGAKLPIALSVRWKERAEARRRAQATARPSFRPRHTIKTVRPGSPVLDGITDVSAVPEPPPARRQTLAQPLPLKLTSPIFIPSHPPFEPLPAPELPSVESYTPTAPADDASVPGLPQADSLPEPPAAEPSAASSLADPPEAALAPGALYLPNYRIDTTAPEGAPSSSRQRLYSTPFATASVLSERFEEFGWSLESDWHVWVGLVLLLAGFLSLAQKPPLVVLTIAFWVAGAVVMMDRRHSRHSPQHAPKDARWQAGDGNGGSVGG